MNIDANAGGNHQCLSFYQHDIVCSLEANCLRKMGLSSFSILPERNHRTKAGLFLEPSSQSINNQASNSEGPPKQTHHGLGNVNLISLVMLFWGRIAVCPCFICSWSAVAHSRWPGTTVSSWNASISSHSLKRGLQELEILLSSSLPGREWWLGSVEGRAMPRKLEAGLVTTFSPLLLFSLLLQFLNPGFSYGSNKP